ncbi:aldo/keto reductase [Liquorilactobacillus satsumensis]|uniref:2,5-diketo-D-gluconic acid reductase n=1 Tax=Liquorilactobacillus satsumensis DSM 16230 = JCM 12392 TaxID=1423801 RepID=A0A0R1V350_9LACO|nr:aldo/keto reductase [Liquorilactobacillus satsumensis]KRM00066.1 2,5-diketo-D-gluconic acid reductase [Liquorilactobacillus satsumensis DSM 16230 = JCM 12392]MCC7667025.1 aldo/keto reductase [Liquorilactobacillus satsumensis]MCP9313299.1 aldo/keto reductase [Liquorilactobacillus satsumensis]MCP9329581.1 aldo/keto reductase [Liquorilactobacillus satsumensis]MCP9358134.1 aldo/keto reductase [Liquorilactobacillus satsumensis]
MNYELAKQTPFLELRDGNRLPQVGFGTYKLRGAAGVNTIQQALNNGYRALDTAVNYENEGSVGAAIRRSSLAREELFISSKLPGRHHQYQEALTEIQESLYRMQLDYFDLYLIHWPNPLKDQYVEAWQALIDAQRFGLVRSIGVSNFLPEHLQRLEKETGVLPVVDQIELHPYWSQPKQLSFDREHGIVTQAWSPLGRANAVLKDPLIKKIAVAHNKTIPQIILRWETQLGAAVIPKSSSTSRQIQNLTLFDFELSAAEVTAISSLDKDNGRTNNQNPAVYQEF